MPPNRKKLTDLINEYWDAAYLEGKEKRNHDTPDGNAGRIRNEIEKLLDIIFEKPTDRASEVHKN